jgi:hypothetical protein
MTRQDNTGALAQSAWSALQPGAAPPAAADAGTTSN